MRHCSGRPALFALLLSACVGGNSGAEGETERPPDEPTMPSPGGSTVPCPCGHLQVHRTPPAALRVSVEAQLGEDRLSLRLQEVIAGTLPLPPGELLEAGWDGSLPCYEGCANVAVGDEAFAFYWVEEAACEERASCIAQCDAENASNNERTWEYGSACSETWARRGFETGRDCEIECEAEVACGARPPERYRRGSVRLAPWADPLVFARGEAGEVSVALDDLDELWPTAGELESSEIAACVERFGDWSQLIDAPGA